MTLHIEPEIGVPFSPKIPYIDLRERIEAMCNAAMELRPHGLEIEEPTHEERERAATLVGHYADDEKGTSKQVTNKRASTLTSAALLYTAGILQEYGHSVAESSAAIRHLVTNKLITETENTDPRVRLKALELLGKISDVGLFSDKTEVTITHRTTDELKVQLRNKLEKLINPEPEVLTLKSSSGEETIIDIDEELGS
jgi:hypothetical protein